MHAAITHRQDMKYHAIQRLEIIEAGEFSMQNLGQFNVQLNTLGTNANQHLTFGHFEKAIVHFHKNLAEHLSIQ